MLTAKGQSEVIIIFVDGDSGPVETKIDGPIDLKVDGLVEIGTKVDCLVE
jgi:hypothetical protein